MTSRNDRPSRIDQNSKPPFLITIDTEGDNLWSKPSTITTRNADFLGRFQRLCESHGLKPTYLTNYEMVNTPSFVEFGRDLVRRRTGEIGMHLHAWNSPPLVPLTENDFKHHPYLIEFPENVMRDKISVMTDLLEETFGTKMISHRAGRWGFNEIYARILIEHGYRVDCSVTPHVSWCQYSGDPSKNGGTDYSDFPEHAYFVDLTEIRLEGDSPLLEIPVTILPLERPLLRRLTRAIKIPLVNRAVNRFLPPVVWLRPTRRNLSQMVGLIQRAVCEQARYVEFMLHSSELMPGGSPTFPESRDIERLYEDLEKLFAVARKSFVGATLTEYYEKLVAQS